jgi:hypothetical protein
MPPHAGRQRLWRLRRHAGDMPKWDLRRGDRRKQHRAGRLADRHYVDRVRRSQRVLDIRGGQRLAHESTGVCGRESRAHHGRQIVAKTRDGSQ